MLDVGGGTGFEEATGGAGGEACAGAGDGADGLETWLGRGSAVADALITGFSEVVEWGRGAGGWGGRGDGAADLGVGFWGVGEPEVSINCLIRSIVGGSTTASALVLTSRPHF